MKSKSTFMKKELEKKKQKKKENKQYRKEERKKNATDGTLENMMAYVNEFGEISSTPPVVKIKPKGS
jgi:hypothetical protein